jgi:hypothetical protein
MLSLHAVRSITVKSHGSSWIELTFDGAEEPVTFCIYAWTGSKDDLWADAFVAALKRGIEALPPTPEAKLLEAMVLPFSDGSR